MESNEYLMKLLNIPNKTELQNFLSKSDRPTGGTKPPDEYYEALDQIAEAQEKR